MAGLPCPNCYSKSRANRDCTGNRTVVKAQAPAPHKFHTTCKMKVTEKDVAYVADLANLELTEDERARMLRDLNSILDYVDRLNELDTTDVPPMAHVSDRYGVDESRTGSARFIYASREDILEGLRKSLPHEVAMGNAPDTDGTFFKVPKVIER